MKSSALSKFGKSEIYRFVKHIPFLACLSSDELNKINHIITKKHFSKNEVILLEEDTPNYMYIVFSGRVKAVQINYDGREKILGIHKEGDYFGEMALLDGRTSPATVIAVENSIIGLISKEDFERFLLAKDRVKSQIISLLCSRLREAWLMLKVISFADAEHRVRAILEYLSAQYGTEKQGGTLIRLKLTHQEIADFASVSRETVSRILHNFIEAGEVENSDHKCLLLKPSFFKKSLFL